MRAAARPNFTLSGVATVARRLRIDVHDNDNNNDNDNAWQRGPLWPHRMGQKTQSICQWTTLIGPSVNKEYLSQIQLYSIFGELPVLSNTVLIITVCVKVANSTLLVTNKRTKWADRVIEVLSMQLFCKVILDCWRLTVTWCIKCCIDGCTKLTVFHRKQK